jgi:hypothetical protein
MGSDRKLKVHFTSSDPSDTGYDRRMQRFVNLVEITHTRNGDDHFSAGYLDVRPYPPGSACFK